ncbi:MaoC family dehydratase N-terminal domain-containing protein [Rhodococcus sp. NPDC003318]|uniref:FAS1-like dehydratase domain-containing protein n=1 Tax=Rhodococcus sp. NPDC003318 TaxID=3364503 RepID=UPI00367F1A46
MATELGTMTLRDVIRYSGASGDDNPLHYDPEFARAAGHERLFAMGALGGGWLLSRVFADAAAGEGAHTAAVRYRAVVPIGSKVAASTVAAENRLTGELTADGVVAVTAEITSGADAAAVQAGEGDDDEITASFLIEIGAARSFARAVRWPHDVADAGAVPPTFVGTITSVLPQPDPIDRVGFDRARTLHGETLITYPRGPLRVGEAFQVREYVTGRRTKESARGAMEFVDVVAELSDASGLRGVYRNTFIQMPPVAPVAEAQTPVFDRATFRLQGSRDPQTGEVFHPPRTYSVDGRFRECEDVDLPAEGELYAFTSFAGQDYGQIDLAGGVRIQAALAAGEHRIGGKYRLDSEDGGKWWFVHA